MQFRVSTRKRLVLMKYTYAGREFVLEHDHRLYVRVQYKNVVGCFGVSTEADGDMIYTSVTQNMRVNELGIIETPTSRHPRNALNDLCERLIELDRQLESKKAFRVEHAEAELDSLLDWIAEGGTVHGGE